eukprot:354244-Chlamydomonas_euryale.AAC.7
MLYESADPDPQLSGLRRHVDSKDLLHDNTGRRGGSLLPDNPLVALGGLDPALLLTGLQAANVIPRTQLHDELIVDFGDVHVVLRRQNFNLGVRLDLVALAHLHEVDDLILQALVPLEHVFPEDAGNAWVRQDVGVANLHLVLREWPVRLRAAGVVVLHERHGALGPPAQEARWLALRILQAVVLRQLHRLLKDALEGEVERARAAASTVDPVCQPLARLVLVVVQVAVVPLEVSPELANIDTVGAHAALDVLLDELSTVALGVVEAPAAKPNTLGQVLHPVREALAKVGVGMVEVGRAMEVLTRVRVASAVEDGVVTCDGPSIPVDVVAVMVLVVAKAVPRAVLVLIARGSVVDDNVGHWGNAGRSQCLVQVDQLLLSAVLGGEVVQLAGHVALRRDGRAGAWRQPHVRNASGLREEG